MIISRIIGGLGNQLFQYAAGLCLAEKHGTRLLLDTGEFENYQLRNFDLSHFNTNIEIATNEQVSQFLNRSFIRKLKDRYGRPEKRRLYKEPHYVFDNSFYSTGDNLYIKGYWQSEKYFLPIANQVRAAFELKKEIITNVINSGMELSRPSSVAIHIRRGDYNTAEGMEMHGILPMDYYRKAIDVMQNKLNNPHFYIFSDDTRGIKNELKIDNCTIISGEKTKTHLEDFYLMGCCSHNIIANSSFSWWAAWLNYNPDKQVIAPVKWFNKGPSTKDLIPTTWLQI